MRTLRVFGPTASSGSAVRTLAGTGAVSVAWVLRDHANRLLPHGFTTDRPVAVSNSTSATDRKATVLSWRGSPSPASTWGRRGSINTTPVAVSTAAIPVLA